MNVPASIVFLGWLEIAFGSIIFLITGGIYIDVWQKGEADAFWHFSAFGFTSFAIMLIVSGYFLGKGSQIARNVVVCLGFVRLLGFPIGTVWGAVIIYDLIFSEGAERLYNDPRRTEDNV